MTAQNPSIPSSGWEVTSQTEGTQIGPAGTIVEGVVVAFRTGHGVVGTVFVANAQYSVSQVTALVAARAAALDAVTGLSAPPA